MIELGTVSECLDTHKSGAKFELPTVGVFYLRRGGLSAWQNAIKEATEEVLGREYSLNEIEPRTNEQITALACVNYLVAKWDDLTDTDGQQVPYSLVNAKNLLEPEENYALVQILVSAANRADMFLLSNVRAEAERLKKSLSVS